jgi:hypothetical protein
MQRTIIRAVGITVAATATLVLAAEAAGAAPPAPPPPTYDLATVINHLRWWVCGIAGTYATFMLSLCGARLMMANGDPSEIDRAKTSFKSAVVGYAVALLAPVFMTILANILQA